MLFIDNRKGVVTVTARSRQSFVAAGLVALALAGCSAADPVSVTDASAGAVQGALVAESPALTVSPAPTSPAPAAKPSPARSPDKPQQQLCKSSDGFSLQPGSRVVAVLRGTRPQTVRTKDLTITRHPSGQVTAKGKLATELTMLYRFGFDKGRCVNARSAGATWWLMPDDYDAVFYMAAAPQQPSRAASTKLCSRPQVGSNDFVYDVRTRSFKVRTGALSSQKAPSIRSGAVYVTPPGDAFVTFRVWYTKDGVCKSKQAYAPAPVRIGNDWHLEWISGSAEFGE